MFVLKQRNFISSRSYVYWDLASTHDVFCRDLQTTGINVSRLLLCKATQNVMEKSFALLGLPTVDKM